MFIKKLNGKPEIRMLVGVIISKAESYFFLLQLWREEQILQWHQEQNREKCLEFKSYNG